MVGSIRRNAVDSFQLELLIAGAVTSARPRGTLGGRLGFLVEGRKMRRREFAAMGTVEFSDLTAFFSGEFHWETRS